MELVNPPIEPCKHLKWMAYPDGEYDFSQFKKCMECGIVRPQNKGDKVEPIQFKCRTLKVMK